MLVFHLQLNQTPMGADGARMLIQGLLSAPESGITRIEFKV